MKKRMISILLCLAMILSLVPISAIPVMAAAHTDHDGQAFFEWKFEGLPTTQGRYIYITKDFSGGWTPVNGNIDLCLNGNTITLDDNSIDIDYQSSYRRGVQIALYNCDPVNGKIVANSNNKYAVNVGTSSSFTLFSGLIEQNGINSQGAIQADLGTVTISGGTVTSVTDGIMCKNGKFEMTGGLIHSTGTNSSGLYIQSSNSLSTVSGGTVKGAYGISTHKDIKLSGAPIIDGTISDIRLLARDSEIDASNYTGEPITIMGTDAHQPGDIIVKGSTDLTKFVKSDSWNTSMPFVVDGNDIVLGDPPHVHDTDTYTAWTSTDGIPTASGTYYLTNNITILGNINMIDYSGVDVTICLNGKTVDLSNARIYVGNSSTASLKICDCSSAAGKITSSGSQETIAVSSYGTFTLDNGTIEHTGNYRYTFSNSGTTTINGGSVTSANRAIMNNTSGTLYVKGGTLRSTGTSGTDAVGLYCNGGESYVSGGTITGNYGINLCTGLAVYGTPAIKGTTADIYFQWSTSSMFGSHQGTPYTGDRLVLEGNSNLTEGNRIISASTNTSRFIQGTGWPAGLYLVPYNGDLFLGKHVHDGNEFKPWTSATSLPTTAGNYFLTSDVTISSTWKPSPNTVLCLNGHDITKTSGSVGRAIVLDKNGSFTLYDCSTGRTRYGAWNGNTYRISDTVPPAAHYDTITGGIIRATDDGAVEIYKAASGKQNTFNMHGGTIAGNNAVYSGSAVKVTDVFNMYGGLICGNYNANGTDTDNGEGAVYNNATFNMYGGKITNNNSRVGGGVYVEEGDTFTLNGGEISYNTAQEGGGVYILSSSAVKNGALQMNNGSIHHNTAKVGGGILVSEYAVLNMDNGSIYENTATVCGGGFWSNGKATVSGGVIRNNTANGTESAGNHLSGYGGGIYIYHSQRSTADKTTHYLHLTGGSITQNSAAVCAGGIYYGGHQNKEDVFLEISGSSTVTGNTAYGSTSNLYLRDGEKLSIPTALTGTIGITLPDTYGNGGVFCDDGDGYQTLFSSDITGDLPLLNGTALYFGYTVTLPQNPTGYTILPETGSVSPTGHGNDYSFKINVEAGYDAANMTVKANGQPLTPNGEIYTISGITEDQTVTVDGIIRNTFTVTLPTGTGYTAVAEAGSASPVNYGGSYSFKINLDAAYDQSVPTVKANGTPITAVGGIYTIENITQNIDVTVEYIKINTYTVIWQNEDGTELEKDENVEHGTIPTYDGSTPTKAATAQYTYSFKEWDKTVVSVTGDVTYKATYTSNVNKYTVTWQNEDGTPLETDTDVEYGTTPTYDGATPTKAATAQYTYSFKEWDKTVVSVTGDVTYKATYTSTLNKYTVTWQNEDGSELEKDENVEYGTIPTYNGATPTKAATAQYTYSFKEWDKTVVSVTGDVTYKATYTSNVNKYTVTWQNEDGSELEKDENVEYGTTPTYDGATPTKAATAQYSYAFKAWTPAVAPIEGDITYTATFDAIVNSYTVTWENADGKVLEQDLNVPYGTTPSYDSAAPTKAADSEFTYEFVGWLPLITNVTGDATYTAVYKATRIPPLPIMRMDNFVTTTGAFDDAAYYARTARAGDIVTLKVSLSALGEKYKLDHRKLTVKYETIGAVQLGANYDYYGNPLYKDGIATDFMLSDGVNQIVAKVYYAGMYCGDFDPFFTLI